MKDEEVDAEGEEEAYLKPLARLQLPLSPPLVVWKVERQRRAGVLKSHENQRSKTIASAATDDHHLRDAPPR